MSITNLTLLGTTTVGTPSGNYDGSSTAFVSDAQKAVGYYRGQGSLQTVTLGVTDLEGILTFQATLDENPDTLNWFDVYTYGDTNAITDYHSFNLTGNFVWLRVAVTEFNSGTIDTVVVAY